MKTIIFSNLIAFICPFLIQAQITTNPHLPVASQKVTIVFDSSTENRLGYFTGELYAHTGVVLEGSNEWQYVIGNWGDNAQQPQLTNLGDGIYELEIDPDINTFYSVPAEEKVVRMAFVFRSSNSTSQTNDLFVDVYEEGLAVQISHPAANTITEKNHTIEITAGSTIGEILKIYVDNGLLTEHTDNSISTMHTFTESGVYWLIAEAEAGNEKVIDSVRILVRNDVQEEIMPAGFRKGINYPSGNEAALVLWAPTKEYVFIVGEFNDWLPDNNFLMKKDGDFFWLEIGELEPDHEYAFQYLIDGTIRIADPYTEKILDPVHDEYIDENIYPELKAYPKGKTEEIASIIHTGQLKYSWEIENFQVPETGKLIIYELLIRDFTEEHSFKSVIEKLDYLQDLNINVLELMPVNEFEGNSSWGYNPSFYFAPDKYYGSRNDLKKLIDECHKRGIAVVMDMVLNHSYGQSPFVRMYMNNWTITPDNPWYNTESNFQNEFLRWGYDFNHEADATRELIDSINSFWINEYKIDGFRFDFTKGFSNTTYGPDSWGSEYDSQRISNLKRMADEIRKRKEDALIIFEHLSDNAEEKELADYGILLWGNMNHTYREAARGNIGNSDLSWGLHTSRNWEQPNLITYAESHDEERIMYQLLNSGFIEGNYNTRELPVALERMELISLFHLPLPGPKMIWQFGERGYDISIDNYGGRLSEKPPRWEYLEDSNRLRLLEVMAQLNHLKQSYEEFTPDHFDYNLYSNIRWYALSAEGNHVFAIGNFDVKEQSATLSFPQEGKWYEFFTRDSIFLDNPSQHLTLAPGDYMLYSTRKFDKAHVVTDVAVTESMNKDFIIYPNPATNEITITTAAEISEIRIYSMGGILIHHLKSGNEKLGKIAVGEFHPGLYILHVSAGEETFIGKFAVR